MHVHEHEADARCKCLGESVALTDRSIIIYPEGH